MSSAITRQLVDQLLSRDAAGLSKYGVSLDRQDLTPEQWLQHLTEELLDGAGYAQAAAREVAAIRRGMDQSLSMRVGLIERVRELEQALAFYAEPKNWAMSITHDVCAVMHDGGTRAKAALNGGTE